MSTKKKVADCYKKGKTFLSKNVIVAFLIMGILTSILGYFTLRPEMFYLCAIIITMSVVTIIVDNRSLNSMVISAIALYTIVLPFQFLFIHVLNLGLAIFVLIRGYKNASPGLIFLTSIFYVFYAYAFWMHVPSGEGDFAFYQRLLTALPLSVYFAITIGLVVVVKSVSKKKSWW